MSSSLWCVLWKPWQINIHLLEELFLFVKLIPTPLLTVSLVPLFRYHLLLQIFILLFSMNFLHSNYTPTCLICMCTSTLIVLLCERKKVTTTYTEKPQTYLAPPFLLSYPFNQGIEIIACTSSICFLVFHLVLYLTQSQLPFLHYGLSFPPPR